jgi:hypothetical protein
MSEYQRYEFMTVDRPLTRAQVNAVDNLSSHIDVSSTHAVVEYNWGDFKHDPIKVLHKYFDGFLYWANWGSPQLAFRFPHGVLPSDLIAHYDFNDWVTFTRHSDYDILDISFGELEAPDMWTDYDLGSLIPIREELIDGDMRALYIAWLAAQSTLKGRTGYRRKPASNDDYDDDEYDEEEDYEEEDYEDDEEEEEEEVDDEEEEKEDYEISIMPVPPGFATLTAAQQSLAELLQVPQELLAVAGQYSSTAPSTAKDDFASWIELLPQNRRTDYLVRLARNEPGLSRLLVKELRELNPDKTKAMPPTGEMIPYATLLAESKTLKARLERERREQERLERERHLQTIHEHKNEYWQQVEEGALRKNAWGYDEATKVLVELRDAAAQFNESQEFQARFHTWIQSHLRRPALLQRLQKHKFTIPQS